MKIILRSNPTLNGQIFWTVQTPKSRTCYEHYEGALQFVHKYILRERKEMSAYSMVQAVSENLLNIDETALIRTLKRTKCRGITKKQYGYLKGIHERQEREW